MKPELCPFCGATIELKPGEGGYIEVGEWDQATDKYTYEGDIHLYVCTVHPEHHFYAEPN